MAGQQQMQTFLISIVDETQRFLAKISPDPMLSCSEFSASTAFERMTVSTSSMVWTTSTTHSPEQAAPMQTEQPSHLLYRLDQAPSQRCRMVATFARRRAH